MKGQLKRYKFSLFSLLYFYIYKQGYWMITLKQIKYVTIQWHANTVTIYWPKHIKRLFCPLYSYWRGHDLRSESGLLSLKLYDITPTVKDPPGANATIFFLIQLFANPYMARMPTQETRKKGLKLLRFWLVILSRKKPLCQLNENGQHWLEVSL